MSTQTEYGLRGFGVLGFSVFGLWASVSAVSVFL